MATITHATYRRRARARKGHLSNRHVPGRHARRLRVVPGRSARDDGPARDLRLLAEVPPAESLTAPAHQLVADLLAQVQTAAALPGSAALLYDAVTDDWQIAAELGQLPEYWPLPVGVQYALLARVRTRRAPVLHAPQGVDAALLLLPLLTADGLIGAFVLPGVPRYRLGARLPVLRALAARAALLLANRQLQLRVDELVLREERDRLRREMHDDLAQTLTHIRNRCELASRILYTDPDRAARELAGVRADLQQIVGDVVQAIQGLRSPALAECGLARALQKLAEECTRRGGLQVALHLPAEPVDLSPHLELALFRLAQHVVFAAARKPGRCWLDLQVAGPQVILAIRLDAVPAGIPAAGAELAGMVQRWQLQTQVAACGGTLDVVVVPGAGLRLTLTVPRAPLYVVAGC